MNNNSSSSSLSIASLVLGILAIFISFVLCVGVFAVLPGLIGLILGAIAFFQAKDNGSPNGLAIAGTVISFIACVLALVQFFYLRNMSESTNITGKYATCAELQIEVDNTSMRMESLAEGGSGNFTEIIKLTTKFAKLKEEADRMGCDIEVKEDIEVDIPTVDSLSTDNDLQ